MKISKSIISILSAVGLMSSQVVMAADYQSEVAYTTYSEEYDGLADVSFGMLSYAYNFERVNTDNKPLAEAAFLERTSSILVGLYGQLVEYTATKEERLASGLGVEYIYMKKDSPLIFEVLYDSAHLQRKSASGVTQYEWDATLLEFTVGWFLDRATAVAASISSIDYAYTTAGYSGNDYSTSGYTIEAKHIIAPESEHAINIHGFYKSDEYDKEKLKNTIIGIAADYYLDRMKSIGAMYITESGDAKYAEGTTTQINGKFFFTDQLSLAVELSSFSAKNTSGSDTNKTLLELAYRF